MLLVVEINGYLEAYSQYDEGELLAKDGFVKDFQRLLRELNNKTGLINKDNKKPLS